MEDKWGRGEQGGDCRFSEAGRWKNRRESQEERGRRREGGRERGREDAGFHLVMLGMDGENDE